MAEAKEDIDALKRFFLKSVDEFISEARRESDLKAKLSEEVPKEKINPWKEGTKLHENFAGRGDRKINPWLPGTKLHQEFTGGSGGSKSAI